MQSKAGGRGCQEHAVPSAGRYRELSTHVLEHHGAFFSPVESKTYHQFGGALALSQEGSRERHAGDVASAGDTATSELKLFKSH